MNSVNLTGRIVKDPELRCTANNTETCSFTLAVKKRIKQGEKDVDFLNCVAWQKTAETIVKYLKKGSQIGVVGRIETRDWTDKEGKKVYVTEIVVESFDFLDSKSDEPTDEKPAFKPMKAESEEDLPF